MLTVQVLRCRDCGVDVTWTTGEQAVARVPFVPRGDRPVHCRDCFNGASR
jgi:CxxC-x17-CxxC domain-containing protein